jgi:hypothetical protein
MQENEQLDAFELALKQKAKVLQECQEQKERKSCTGCELFFDCETRKEYVNSCYNSMSKGNTGSDGGFDF